MNILQFQKIGKRKMGGKEEKGTEKRQKTDEGYEVPFHIIFK